MLEAYKNKVVEAEGLVSRDNHGIAGSPGTWWKGDNLRDAVLPSYQLYRSAGVGCIGGGVTVQVKGNTKCSSVEVLWEKRSTIVSLWVEILTLIVSVVLGLYY